MYQMWSIIIISSSNTFQCIHMQPGPLRFYQNIKYQQVHSEKLLSGAVSPSCRPGGLDQYSNNLRKIIKRQTDPYVKAIYIFSTNV